MEDIFIISDILGEEMNPQINKLRLLQEACICGAFDDSIGKNENDGLYQILFDVTSAYIEVHNKIEKLCEQKSKEIKKAQHIEYTQEEKNFARYLAKKQSKKYSIALKDAKRILELETHEDALQSKE